MWPIWGSLRNAVMSGDSGCANVYQMSFYDLILQDPELRSKFSMYMHRISSASATELSNHISPALNGTRKIVDVGGGYGVLLTELLRSHPSISGILFDLPPVARAAERYIPKDVRGRIEIVGGDMHTEVPHGADAYIVSSVLSDWADGDAVSILSTCAQAMGDSGQAIVVEKLHTGQPSRHESLMDLQMILLFGAGGLRSRHDFERLFTAAQLDLTKETATSTMTTIMHCAKAS